MEVRVEKLTGLDLMRKACAFTSGRESTCSLTSRYVDEHSPIRTQIFSIELFGVKTFVSVHLVRHGKFAEHWVKSNRDDRIVDPLEVIDRNTLLNHMVLTNAQELIAFARKRLCHKSHAETRDVMKRICEGVQIADPFLYPFLVPECVYRGGYCHEHKCCGKVKGVKSYKQLDMSQFVWS